VASSSISLGISHPHKLFEAEDGQQAICQSAMHVPYPASASPQCCVAGSTGRKAVLYTHCQVILYAATV
jgi:hypothetical protein